MGLEPIPAVIRHEESYILERDRKSLRFTQSIHNNQLTSPHACHWTKGGSVKVTGEDPHRCEENTKKDPKQDSNSGPSWCERTVIILLIILLLLLLLIIQNQYSRIKLLLHDSGPVGGFFLLKRSSFSPLSPSVAHRGSSEHCFFFFDTFTLI